MIDIPLFKVHSPKNIGEKIQEVFSTGFIGEGQYSDEFGKQWNFIIDTRVSSV